MWVLPRAGPPGWAPGPRSCRCASPPSTSPRSRSSPATWVQLQRVGQGGGGHSSARATEPGQARCIGSTWRTKPLPVDRQQHHSSTIAAPPRLASMGAAQARERMELRAVEGYESRGSCGLSTARTSATCAGGCVTAGRAGWPCRSLRAGEHRPRRGRQRHAPLGLQHTAGSRHGTPPGCCPLHAVPHSSRNTLQPSTAAAGN